MKHLLLILIAGVASCSTLPVVSPRNGTESGITLYAGDRSVEIPAGESLTMRLKGSTYCILSDGMAREYRVQYPPRKLQKNACLGFKSRIFFALNADGTVVLDESRYPPELENEIRTYRIEPVRSYARRSPTAS